MGEFQCVVLITEPDLVAKIILREKRNRFLKLIFRNHGDVVLQNFQQRIRFCQKSQMGDSAKLRFHRHDVYICVTPKVAGSLCIAFTNLWRLHG